MMPLAAALFSTGMNLVIDGLSEAEVDEGRFALHLGIGAEQVLKAHLANTNPLLIADRDKVETLRWLSNEGKHNAPPPSGVRTISFEVALLRCPHFGLDLTQEASDLAQLVIVRNQIAHMGSTDYSKVLSFRAPVLSMCQKVGRNLGLNDDEIFGGWRDFAIDEIGRRTAADEQALKSLMVAAKARFEERYGEYSEGDLKALRQGVLVQQETKTSETQIVDCPACGMPSLVDGGIDIVDWEPDYDEGGNVDNVSPVLEYTPHSLRCPFCGLKLRRELIMISGAMENWQLPHEDEEEFMEAYRDEMRWDHEYYEADR